MFTICVILYCVIAVIAFNILIRENMANSMLFDFITAVFWLPVGIGIAMFAACVLFFVAVKFLFYFLKQSIMFLGKFGEDMGKKA